MIPIRDENPAHRPPVMTVLLLVANVLAFLYEMALPEQALQAFVMMRGAVPARITTEPLFGGDGGTIPALTLLTSMFLHGGFMHLAGNMLYLWVFGNNVEDRTGHVRFLLFYVLSGLAAAGAQIVMSPDSQLPMIGASGAIAGVLGAYMLLFPHARVLTLVPFFWVGLVHLPAVVVLGLWFLFQILMSWSEQAGTGGVAFFAHIGGFVAGMLLIWVFLTRHPHQALEMSAKDERYR